VASDKKKKSDLISEIAFSSFSRLPGSRPEAASGFALEQAGET
jgi:hypothetical protein